MLEWFNETIIWAYKESRITYAVIVIVVMAGLGSLIGICADLFIRALGLNLDKYTDSHT